MKVSLGMFARSLALGAFGKEAISDLGSLTSVSLPCPGIRYQDSALLDFSGPNVERGGGVEQREGYATMRRCPRPLGSLTTLWYASHRMTDLAVSSSSTRCISPRAPSLGPGMISYMPASILRICIRVQQCTKAWLSC